jgi:nitroreductase
VSGERDDRPPDVSGERDDRPAGAASEAREGRPEIGLREAIFSLRAMRRLEPDPVPEQHLRFLVEAATQAPSASNSQNWAFVIVTDAELRRRIGEIYREIGRAVIRDQALASGRLPESTARVYRNAMILVERLGDAPALVVVAARGRPPSDPLRASSYYGSIYPAVQNLMLAARSLGLGTTLTTLHKAREDDVRELLGIPDGWETVCLIPVGYPRGRFGPPLREPVGDVTHWNGWGRHEP